MSDIARRIIMSIINFSKTCFHAYASFFRSNFKDDESNGDIEFTTFENEHQEPDNESEEDTNSFDICELTEDESNTSSSSIEIIEDPGEDAETTAQKTGSSVKTEAVDEFNMDTFIMTLSSKLDREHLTADQLKKIRKDTVKTVETLLQKYKDENSSENFPRA
ncbi:unnamed protein product [Hermetia illucens]|uniref:Uncharacterized protein n=1 Tax=Hermetia illucens TaxID=343691 RepID=A0A7R8YS39_HERIL|nr:uncharacterized protein LOC119650216 [Hermetia illucens]CAD7082155.1 unnamed protein product [Hermetia illucens]